jgi:tetrahydromethanopterin S-methyltransferase subunit C
LNATLTFNTTKSKCSTQVVVLKESVTPKCRTESKCSTQMAVLKLSVALKCQFWKCNTQYCHLNVTLTSNTAIWLLHLLSILPFECYTYFKYWHVSATLTLNTAIWVLHLVVLKESVTPKCSTESKCSTQMAVLKVSVALKCQFWKCNTQMAVLLMLLFECYTYFYYCPLSATLTFNTVIRVLHFQYYHLSATFIYL